MNHTHTYTSHTLLNVKVSKSKFQCYTMEVNGSNVKMMLHEYCL